MVRHLLSLFFFVFISVAYIHAQCNGDSAICNKQYDHVVYVTTHNAFNYSGSFQAPNQTYPVSQQLQDGVRAFMLDVHDYFGVPTLYHGVFALGTEPLEDVLIDIRDFMDQNQNEVVTLIFECYVSADDMDTVFTAAGLKPYLHEQSVTSPWPTLQEMINSDKRLVVLTDVDDASVGQEWYHYMWDYCVETHYTANSRADFSCDFNRGDSINSLFILNNFITSILGTGMIDSATAINSNPYLLNRANQCMGEKGKLPNFLTVDFYEVGDVFDVKDNLNDNFTGMNQLNQINNIDLYPNPVCPNTNLVVEFTFDRVIADVRIVDLTGKLCVVLPVNQIMGKINIDTGKLDLGFYLLQFTNENSVVDTRKFEVIQ